MTDRICPILSKGYMSKNQYGSEIPDINWIHCQENKCQLWITKKSGELTYSRCGLEKND